MHPFEIMAEPVRRRIVEILASGEHSAGDIAEAVGREFGTAGDSPVELVETHHEQLEP